MPAAPVMRRPLIGVAAAFMGGTSIGLHGGSLGAGCAAALVLGVAWLVISFRSRRDPGRVTSGSAMVALALLLALVWTATAAREAVGVHQRDGLMQAVGDDPERTVHLRGTVISVPRVTAGRHGGWRHAFWIRLRDGVEIGEVALPARDQELQVHWYGPHPEDGGPVPLKGSTWLLSGRLQLRTRRDHTPFLRLTASRDSSSLYAPHGPFQSVARIAAAAREGGSRRLALGIEDCPDTVALLNAILLGVRDDVPARLEQSFRQSGTLHVFAISGLHVGMLCVLLTVLLPAIGLDRRHWVFVIGPILVFYAVCTGGRPSAWRATTMAVIYFAGPLLGRKPDILSALAAAAIGIVAYRPHDLYDAGFVFSFVVVLGIILLGGGLRPHCHRWLKGDREQLDLEAMGLATDDQTAGELRTLRWRIRLRNHAADLLAMSIAAWLSAAPLMAYFFGRVTPVGLIANLLIVPGAFMTVLCGWLSLSLGSVSGVFSIIFNHAAMVWVRAMVGLNQLLAALPGGSWQIRKAPLLPVLLAYVALGVLSWRLRPRAPETGAEWLT